MKKTAQATPNYKLKKEREIRSWSQLELADHLGTTARNVSRWERGITLPGPHFRRELCELFGKKLTELGFLEVSAAEVLPETPPADLEESAALLRVPVVPGVPSQHESSLWNIPYQRNPFFTGRDTLLEQMHLLLTQGQVGANPFTLALSGLGGVGKTQLALEYTYRYFLDYQAIFWVHAETPETLLADYARMAEMLQLPYHQPNDGQRLILAVKQWFHANSRWLLVLDCANDLAAIHEVLPNLGNGHILLTTQAQATGSVACRLRIEPMEPEEGVRFLFRRARFQDAGLARFPALAQPRLASAHTLVSALGGLPLALDQAAAYIEETGCDIAGYLERYQAKQLALLERRGRSAYHPLSVVATWSRSFERVRRSSVAAAALLKVCAFLRADPLEEEFLVQVAARYDTSLQLLVDDLFERDAAIDILSMYSLVQRDTARKSLSIHRLVQEVVRNQMQEPERRQWFEKVGQMLPQSSPPLSVF